MANKIVAVKGKQSVGKTTSIRLAYRLFLEQLEKTPISYDVKYISYQYDKGWDEDFMDFTATVTVSGYPVIFHSPGDTAWFVELLRSYHDQPCLIIICATRTRGYSVERFNEFAAEFNYVADVIKKNELTDEDNNDKAKRLLNMIGAAINEMLSNERNAVALGDWQVRLLKNLSNELKYESIK